MKENNHDENTSPDYVNIEALLARKTPHPPENDTYQGLCSELNGLDELFTSSLSQEANNNPFHQAPEIQAANLVKQKKTSKLRYYFAIFITFMFALILL